MPVWDVQIPRDSHSPFEARSSANRTVSIPSQKARCGKPQPLSRVALSDMRLGIYARLWFDMGVEGGCLHSAASFDLHKQPVVSRIGKPVGKSNFGGHGSLGHARHRGHL